MIQYEIRNKTKNWVVLPIRAHHQNPFDCAYRRALDTAAKTDDEIVIMATPLFESSFAPLTSELWSSYDAR